MGYNVLIIYIKKFYYLLYYRHLYLQFKLSGLDLISNKFI